MQATVAAVKVEAVGPMVAVEMEAETVAVEEIAEPLQPAVVEQATQEAAEEAVSALQAHLPLVHPLVQQTRPNPPVTRQVVRSLELWMRVPVLRHLHLFNILSHR